jgi:hypothetical protein
VIDSGGVDSTLQFRLERVGNRTQHCRKMKQRQHNSAVTSVGGEAASGRGKKGDNTNWVDANLTRLKNEENLRDRFSCYKWTMNI